MVGDLLHIISVTSKGYRARQGRSGLVSTMAVCPVATDFRGAPVPGAWVKRTVQTRQIVSDDHNNALAMYAAKNSTVVKEKSSNATSEAEKSANLESTKPLYLLGGKIVTTSTSADKRTLKCSGSMSVTVGDAKASKEVNFTVQQSSDGKITVSVAPFQF
jgi:hypothetical protein